MDTSKLNGCGTAIVTPFRKDGSVDEEALRNFVNWQIEEGINFLVPCGTTGESVTLTSKEQHRVVEIVLETANKRVPVIAGAGGYDTAAIVDKAKAFERLGVDGLLSVTPYYNKPMQEGLYQHYRAIAEAVSLPIIVYNVPPRTNVNLLPDTLMRLAEIPNIVGVKEASGDISQITEIALRMPDDFKLLSGDDSMTLPLIAVGGHGLISVASNEAPRQLADFTHACLQGDWEAARRWNKELMPLMKVNFVETSPGPVKAALAMMGKIEEVYRLPMVPVTPATKEKLRTVLTNLKLM